MRSTESESEESERFQLLPIPLTTPSLTIAGMDEKVVEAVRPYPVLCDKYC